MDIDHQIAAALGFPKTKYMAVERERRWIAREVPRDRVLHTEAITDLYVTGTRLRLRKAQRTDTREMIFKLSRKADVDPQTRLITTIYLPEQEFAVLGASLTGVRISKLRYRLRGGPGLALAIDEFSGHLAGLLILEAEFDTDDRLSRFDPPDFALREVTDDLRFTGPYLARYGRSPEQGQTAMPADFEKIETVRLSYLPERIMTLFVGESAPASGKFFYTGDSLTAYMRSALGLEQRGFEEFLALFKGRCWYLDDLVIGRSVNDIKDNRERMKICSARQGDLADRIGRYRPAAVVLLKRTIENMVLDATRTAALHAKFFAVPFPGSGNKPRFIAAMQKILPELPHCA